MHSALLLQTNGNLKFLVAEFDEGMGNHFLLMSIEDKCILKHNHCFVPVYLPVRRPPCCLFMFTLTGFCAYVSVPLFGSCCLLLCYLPVFSVTACCSKFLRPVVCFLLSVLRFLRCVLCVAVCCMFPDVCFGA